MASPPSDYQPTATMNGIPNKPSTALGPAGTGSPRTARVAASGETKTSANANALKVLDDTERKKIGGYLDNLDKADHRQGKFRFLTFGTASQAVEGLAPLLGMDDQYQEDVVQNGEAVMKREVEALQKRNGDPTSWFQKPKRNSAAAAERLSDINDNIKSFKLAADAAGENDDEEEEDRLIAEIRKLRNEKKRLSETVDSSWNWNEWEEDSTQLVDYYKYVVDKFSSEEDCPNGVRDKGRGGVSLQYFLDSDECKKAGLQREHVIALRLYTTVAYKYINDPLRNIALYRDGRHPLAAAAFYIHQGIKMLRAYVFLDEIFFFIFFYFFFFLLMASLIFFLFLLQSSIFFFIHF